LGALVFGSAARAGAVANANTTINTLVQKKRVRQPVLKGLVVGGHTLALYEYIPIADEHNSPVGKYVPSISFPPP
jgi:hypothetical protein